MAHKFGYNVSPRKRSAIFVNNLKGKVQRQVRARLVDLKKLGLLCSLALFWAGCSLLKGEQSGIVIARRAQLRSSTAVVAADLLEVTRGDQVDILDSALVGDTNEKEKWVLVRAHDDDKTEGWIEARNVMPQDVLEKSQAIAEQDKPIPSQAAGQLRAASNLRLSPERNTSDNIMMKMETGASFEIVGWQYVEKPKGEAIETDVAPKSGTQNQANVNNKRGSGDDTGSSTPEKEEKYELWYRVRLAPSVSPAPAGWIYGKQVELQVPSDIIFYRTGREFVAWARLDGSGNPVGLNLKRNGEEEDIAETKPGSWVILERSSSEEPHQPGEPDFDRIYVLGYDRDNQEHYTVYRSPDVKGYLPLQVANSGEEKAFTVKIKDANGQEESLNYTLYRNERGILKINLPSNAPKKQEDSGKKK